MQKYLLPANSKKVTPINQMEKACLLDHQEIIAISICSPPRKTSWVLLAPQLLDAQSPPSPSRRVPARSKVVVSLARIDVEIDGLRCWQRIPRRSDLLPALLINLAGRSVYNEHAEPAAID